MMPVQRDQFLAGEKSQPQEERHRRIAEVCQSGRGFQIRLLDHVRRIDAPLQPAIEPQRNHAPQPVLVLCQQRSENLPVAPRRLFLAPVSFHLNWRSFSMPSLTATHHRSLMHAIHGCCSVNPTNSLLNKPRKPARRDKIFCFLTQSAQDGTRFVPAEMWVRCPARGRLRG